MSFEKIVKDIRALKIQGAQNVAKFSVDAMLKYSNNIKSKNDSERLKEIKKAKEILFKTRPTEPLMRNVLNFMTNNLTHSDDVLLELKKRSEEIKKRFIRVEEKISIYGARHIKNNSVIFTHCHSSSVMNAMKLAKKSKKNFFVLNTETRPLFQGRLSAKELSLEGISVTHFVDSAARVALKKADMMMIGADAITSDGKVINKIGSEMFAEIANKLDVPVYILTDSWKFDPLSIKGYEEKIEERDKKEVWSKSPKGVRISNLAFEKIHPSLITGIISELGIFKPEIFVEEVMRKYPYIL